MVDIPMDKAELLSMLLEGILYGFSLLMFGGTIWELLLSQQSTHRLNRKMLTAACLLLLISTVHIIIDIIRVMQGLILYRDTFPGGPVGFFTDWSQWTFVSKNLLYTAQSLIGDGVILYRCYMVWQSKLIMVIPVLCWCSALVTGIGGPYNASLATQGNTVIFSGNLGRWITSFFATAFTTNVLTTFLLAFRIWYLDHKVAKLRTTAESRLRDILRIIIDAGVIYFLTLLVGLFSFVLGSNSQFVILDMIVPIISITFYMVIIRVGMATRANHSKSDPHPLRHTSTGTGTESRNKMQVQVTTMSHSWIDDEGRSSPPPSPKKTAFGGNQTGNGFNYEAGAAV